MNTEEYIARANIKHDNKYVYDRSVFSGLKNNIIITCKEHGDFQQMASHHLYRGSRMYKMCQ